METNISLALLITSWPFITCSECAKKSSVEEKRAAAIRGFYKKWSPENVDKADALAKKADSNGKMAALFRKLVTKYPKSIKVEVSLCLSMFAYFCFCFVQPLTYVFCCNLAAPFQVIHLLYCSAFIQTNHMRLLMPPRCYSSIHRCYCQKVDDEMKLYQDMMNKAKDEKADDGSDEHDEF